MSGSVGSQKTNNTGYTSSTTMPIIPEEWSKAYQETFNALGPTGLTQSQQGYLNDIGQNRDNQQFYKHVGYYGLGDFSKNFGGQWATPEAVSAPTVTADQVSALNGADFMNAYRNPWDANVVDASIADYNANVDRTANAMRAARDASGAFGDRAAIADAIYQGDASRGFGALVSGLRQQGFNTAADFGQQDAARALQAAGMNQSANLQASMANAANVLGAQQFNNTMTNDRQQFDINSGFQGDQIRMQALRDINDSTLAQNTIDSGALGQMLALLGTGTSTFGSRTEGKEMSTSKTKSKGGGL